MTLSLDDVRNKRFRMARKSGYEVMEVDEFVDEVEVAVEQLTEENQNLKKQIEALKAAPAPAEPAAATTTADPAAPAAPAEPETIVVTTAAEASSAVVRLVSLSTEQAERLVAEATAEAATIRDEASSSAQELTGDAQARAERLTADAQQAADQLQADARGRADHLDAETATRRSALLDGLHGERDELQAAIGRLREFEAGFRANLAQELRDHLASVESRSAQPADVPPLAESAAVADATARTGAADGTDTDAASTPDQPVTEGGSADDDGSVFPREDPAEDSQGDHTSDTPRLDALLGDQR